MDKSLVLLLLIFLQSQIALSQENSHSYVMQIELKSGITTYDRYQMGGSVNFGVVKNRIYTGVGIGALHTTETFVRRGLNYSSYTVFPAYLRINYDIIRTSRFGTFLLSDIGIPIEFGKIERNTKPFYLTLGLGERVNIGKSAIYVTAAYSYNRKRNNYTFFNSSPLFLTSGLSDWFRGHSIELSVGFRYNSQ
ncbi:hypothetical protein GYB22_06960 [bacterium]|nr:hypothetical protein [bacterium]